MVHLVTFSIVRIEIFMQFYLTQINEKFIRDCVSIQYKGNVRLQAKVNFSGKLLHKNGDFNLMT